MEGFGNAKGPCGSAKIVIADGAMNRHARTIIAARPTTTRGGEQLTGVLDTVMEIIDMITATGGPTTGTIDDRVSVSVGRLKAPSRTE